MTGTKVRCSQCRKVLGTQHVVKDLGIFRQVETAWTAPYFHYHVGVGEVSLRCIPCAAPGCSPEFEARMLRYAARERAMIEERRVARRARFLSINTFDPGQTYIDDIDRIHKAYREAVATAG